MSKDVAKLKKLAHISGLAFRAAQAEMAALLKRETDLRTNLAQLTDSKAALTQKDRRSDEPALVAGADIRWHHWVDQRRATINTELAQVLALKENCRTKLRIVFGRDQATQKLLNSAVAASQIAKRRRSDYES